MPIPEAPEILLLPVPEAPILQYEIVQEQLPAHDEYGPPELPPVIPSPPEVPHVDYGPPPQLPLPEPYPIELPVVPEIITTTLSPTTVYIAPYAPPATTTTTTSAPYPERRQIYPGRVESHYDGNSGIFRNSEGVLRQVAIQRPSHLGNGPVEFQT